MHIVISLVDTYIYICVCVCVYVCVCVCACVCICKHQKTNSYGEIENYAERLVMTYTLPVKNI